MPGDLSRHSFGDGGSLDEGGSLGDGGLWVFDFIRESETKKIR